MKIRDDQQANSDYNKTSNTNKQSSKENTPIQEVMDTPFYTPMQQLDTPILDQENTPIQEEIEVDVDYCKELMEIPELKTEESKGEQHESDKYVMLNENKDNSPSVKKLSENKVSEKKVSEKRVTEKRFTEKPEVVKGEVKKVVNPSVSEYSVNPKTPNSSGRKDHVEEHKTPIQQQQN